MTGAWEERGLAASYLEKGSVHCTCCGRVIVWRAWVVDGRLAYAGPSRPGADVQVLRGWVLPGLVDAHCHVGLDAHGAVDEATVETQARTDRDAGTLLIRDAGSPADTRWVDGRDDLPRIIRAGRHLARPRRYQPGYAHEIEPDELTAYVAEQLSVHKRPREVRFVDALPRNEMGKVQKARLVG